MKFTKMEGAGNDYIYIDARTENLDWPELSRRMSDRHFGVGADGIILIKDSDSADLKMITELRNTLHICHAGGKA